jgi:hypothetical protein
MGFHPLVDSVTHLKDEELYNKITELTNKMNSAYRLGSGDALRQMQMIMQHYQDELANRNRKRLEDMEKNSKNFSKIIDIKK